MTTYCLIKDGTVVNRITAVNPVSQSAADALMADWRARLATWETVTQDRGPRPAPPEAWAIPEGHILGPDGGAIGDTWDGATYTTPPVAAPELAAVKTAALARIDADAERQRLRHISTGSGMALTYNEKHAQARAVLALGEGAANALAEADAIDLYPTLSASVGIEAPTLWGCAQIVVARYEAFADLSRGIERARLAGKKAVTEATDGAAVASAYGAIQWPA